MLKENTDQPCIRCYNDVSSYISMFSFLVTFIKFANIVGYHLVLVEALVLPRVQFKQINLKRKFLSSRKEE